MPTNLLPRSTFHLGLDLGLRRNPSALAILEELTRKTGEFDHVTYVPRTETVLILRHIHALPLETPYADIPDVLSRCIRSLSAAHIQQIHLAVDATGLGAPVVELLQRARLPVALHPIVITAGQSVAQLPHAASVPREALLQNIRIHLELSQVRIPSTLPNLAEFQTQIASLGTTKPVPNDMAFAFALALWSARPQPYIGEGSTPIPGSPGGDTASAIRRLERLLEDKSFRRRR